MAEKKGQWGSDVGSSMTSGLLKAGAGLLSFPETIWNLAGHGGAAIERKLGIDKDRRKYLELLRMKKESRSLTMNRTQQQET